MGISKKSVKTPKKEAFGGFFRQLPSDEKAGNLANFLRDVALASWVWARIA
jgi:hypothetical protein